MEEKKYTARELEIAFCLGLLNQNELTMDHLSDQLKSSKFEMIKKFIDGLPNPLSSETQA